jgi:hypothetical protein
LLDLILVGTYADKCTNSADVIASIKKRFVRIKFVVLHLVVAVNGRSLSSVRPLLDALFKQAATIDKAPKNFSYLRALVVA